MIEKYKRQRGKAILECIDINSKIGSSVENIQKYIKSMPDTFEEWLVNITNQDVLLQDCDNIYSDTYNLLKNIKYEDSTASSSSSSSASSAASASASSSRRPRSRQSSPSRRQSSRSPTPGTRGTGLITIPNSKPDDFFNYQIDRHYKTF